MKKSHAINAVLPLALLLLFALCAALVLLFAADVYSNTQNASALNGSSGTMLAYISEKIHRCDEYGSVALGSFDGCESIIISQNINGKNCRTYIYKYEDSLTELFAWEDAPVTAAFGSAIGSIAGFDMQELSPGVFRFSCTDSAGETASVIVSVKSGE